MTTMSLAAARWAHATPARCGSRARITSWRTATSCTFALAHRIRLVKIVCTIGSARASRVDVLPTRRAILARLSSDCDDRSPAWYVLQSAHHSAGIVAPFRTPRHMQIDYGTEGTSAGMRTLIKHRN